MLLTDKKIIHYTIYTVLPVLSNCIITEYFKVVNEQMFFVSGILLCQADENEARLMRHLMTNYDAAVRPVSNSSLPLSVIFGVSLHHIIDVVRIQKFQCFFTLSYFITHF